MTSIVIIPFHQLYALNLPQRHGLRRTVDRREDFYAYGLSVTFNTSQLGVYSIHVAGYFEPLALKDDRNSP